MKHLKFLPAVLLALVYAVIPVLPVHADSTNLIANPSAETANGTQPANWTADKWGTNTTTMTWATNGHTGSRSLAISMSKYTSGDAKWIAAPVSVTPGTSYTYTSWYKTAVATELDLQFTDSANNTSYAYVQSVPASTAWKQLTATFTVPAGAQKVTVLHLLNKVGALQTDDFSLTANTTTPTPPVDTDNLLANSSFETANGTLPASWTSNKWGTNTATMNYLSTGRTGSKSVSLNMTAYTNGDAKWMPNAVNVVAGKSYKYYDWYKSNVSTRVVLAYQDATGNTTYAEMPSAAAATNWTQYTTNFTVPATAVKVSIYHLIDRVGNLTMDDTSLAVATPTAPTNIDNPSVETVSSSDSTVPTNWTKGGWGTNTANYQYVNEGHTGSKSVKVTVSNYTDGDAKWYYNPISTLTPGKQYRFTTWYKTNTIPHAVAMFLKADGTEQYFGMPDPQPATNSGTIWQKYSETFQVPSDAVAVSNFLFVSNNGWVQTDDVSLTDYVPVGFNQPLLTMTFDDGEEDNVTNALPLLTQYGFKTTQCFATTFIESNPAQATTNVKAFYNAGHEICSHTVTHPFLTKVDDTQLAYELTHSKQYLEGIIGQPVTDFASPYGDYNAHVNDAIKAAGYAAHRTVDEGYNSKDNYDPYRLRVQNILNTTTPQQIQAWIDQAKADKTWLILVFHRIGDNPEQYDSSVASFKSYLDVIKNGGISVKTFHDGLVDTKAQL